MTRTPHIVIGSDGRILAATGMPAAVLDADLEHSSSLPPQVREAARALLARLRHTNDRVVATSVAVDDVSVHLVAVEALPIRRMPTDLRALVSSKLALLASQALAAEVDLKITVAHDVPDFVHVDAEKTAWALTTLVGNALRYVQASRRRHARGTIGVHVAYHVTGDEVSIEVRDDGPGIPAETAARLFKRDGLNVRGSGLGLLLISEIFAAHGGRVEVRSSMDAVDHGTSVRLAFPAR